MINFNQRVKVAHQLVPIYGLLVAGLGLVGLARMDSPSFATWAQMSPLSGIVLTLGGLALAAIGYGRQLAAKIVSIVCLLAGLVSLPVGIAIGWIPSSTSHTSLAMAITFMLLAVAVTGMAFKLNYRGIGNQVLGYAVLTVASLKLVVIFLHKVGIQANLLALMPTAVAWGLLLVGWAITLWYAERWPGTIINGDGAGGRLFRLLLPVDVILPLVIAVLYTINSDLRILSNAIAIALSVIVSSIGSTALLFVAASLIDREDAERRRLLAKTARLDSLKNRFIEIITHELQTPLSEIGATAGLLASGSMGELNEAQKSLVQAMSNSNQTAVKRIEDMSYLMDIERGLLAVSKSAGSLADLAKGVKQARAEEIAAKKLKIVVTPHPVDPSFFDLEKIRRVIDKLVENAIDYTPANGHISINIEATSAGQRVEIKDTGIGIPIGEQADVFNSFFRASNAVLAKPDGEGVGLTLAKAIIDQHAGKIGFTSAEGKGSTFWFELPTQL